MILVAASVAAIVMIPWFLFFRRWRFWFLPGVGASVLAIPAVIAYNRYADAVSRLELRYDAFMEEFSTILQRYAGRGG
jgi:hypothetical protein